jgi:hypothetical protein
MRHRNLLSLVALLGLAVPRLISQEAKSSTLPPPTVTSGIDGILEAFQTHPVVGLGDIHGMAQEEDFYAALIRDPRFAKDVGNVVVEFGDAQSKRRSIAMSLAKTFRMSSCARFGPIQSAGFRPSPRWVI